MHLRQAIASSLQLFAVFSFFCLSAFFFGLPFLPEARIYLSNLLLTEDEACWQIGTIFCALGFLFFIGFYAVNRGKELVLKMGLHPVSVHMDAIEEIIGRTLQKKELVLHGVEIVNGKKLAIAIKIESMDEEALRDLLNDVERSLETLLRERFGYFKPFHLIVKT